MGSTPVDLEDLVERFAKDFFKRKADSRKEKKIVQNERLGVLIDWKRVRFQHDPPVYAPEPPTAGSGTPINNCLFHTTFANKTDSAQTYNFKAERTTRSSCEVTIEQGFTQGYEVSIKLATPCEIFEANAGFQREISLTNVSSEVIEEELAWGVNSDIQVKPRHKADAKMIIREEEYDGSFSIKTTVRGIVKYSFTNLKDNNSFIRAGEVDLITIMQWAKNNKILPAGDTVTLNAADKSIVLMSKGKCKFKYGLEQHIEVDQTQMEQ